MSIPAGDPRFSGEGVRSPLDGILTNYEPRITLKWGRFRPILAARSV